jgi:hypothetical protein
MTVVEFWNSGTPTVIASTGTVVLKVATERFAGMVMCRIEMQPRYTTMLSVPKTDAGTDT